jgi:hypothetical protein
MTLLLSSSQAYNVAATVLHEPSAHPFTLVALRMPLLATTASAAAGPLADEPDRVTAVQAVLAKLVDRYTEADAAAAVAHERSLARCVFLRRGTVLRVYACSQNFVALLGKVPIIYSTSSATMSYAVPLY